MQTKTTLRLDHIGVNTFNEETTIKFYETLGFKTIEDCSIFLEENHITLMENERGSKIEIAAYRHNALSLARKSLTKEGFNHYAFITKDINVVYDNMKEYASSIGVVLKDHRNRNYFFCTDPNGVRLEIIEDCRERS
ncbi:MAG: VOC family protein [Oscillospiraceae bacterium]|nr:VOC family protein [Oscillospiraceae bacterium]